LQIKLLPYEYGHVLKVTLETPADSEHYPRAVIMIDSKLGLPDSEVATSGGKVCKPGKPGANPDRPKI